jgi:hypothetical protein
MGRVITPAMDHNNINTAMIDTDEQKRGPWAGPSKPQRLRQP